MVETNDPQSVVSQYAMPRPSPSRSPPTPRGLAGLSQATFKISGGTGVFNGRARSCRHYKRRLLLRLEREDPLSGRTLISASPTIRIRRPLHDAFIQQLQGRLRDQTRRIVEPLHSPSGPSKAPFALSAARASRRSSCPSRLSWDWSPYTGRCDTKDPTGVQPPLLWGRRSQYCPSQRIYLN